MRWVRLAAASTIVVAVCCACGAGPSLRPVVAVVQEGNSGGGEPSTTQTPELPLPELQTPKTDLQWRDCTQPMLNLYGLGAGPNGLILECAELSAPIDATGAIYGSFTLGALRARLPQTPADAPPLVLTSGSDRASTSTLAGLAAGPVGGLLASRPIVAIDRRGIGNSTPIDCIPPQTRREMLDNAQFSGGDAADAIAGLSQDATIACKDFLQPQELAFAAPHAADDLEQLRMQWQVDSLAILGTGNGANVALTYAAKYPQHVARLILDSPEGVGLDAQTLTEQRVQGAEAALAAFGARCTGMNCSLGPDPHGAVLDLLGKARRGELGAVSANALLTAISGFLGSPRGDQPMRVGELSDALSSARAGDLTGLNTLITREEALTASDGQFITRCSDGQQWPGPQTVRDLVGTWDQKYPVFGREAATAMVACSAWPVISAPAPPKDLKLPVLALSAAADPVVGNGGLGSVTGAVDSGGGRASVLTWQGWGHPVVAHSGCAQQAVVDYVNSGRLPPNGTVCPA